MSKLQSVLSCKCPNCNEGSLFKQPFKLSTALEMPEKCENCGLDFFPEPGFYYGAMFVGYIITSILFVGIMIALMFGLGLSVEASFGLLLVFAAVTYIYFFRLARSVWIHISPKVEDQSKKSSI